MHAFHTVDYMSQVALPALEEGLERSGRKRDMVTVGGGVFVCVEPAQEEMARAQIAFYGSTRMYPPVFEVHGWGDLTDKLRAAVARGEWAEAAKMIDDDVLAAFAISAPTWEEAAVRLRERHFGVFDRVSIYAIGSDEALRVARAFVAATN